MRRWRCGASSRRIPAPEGDPTLARALIINADDLGYDPGITRGILQAMREGVVSSATLLVNAPDSGDAARQARGLAIGLHLNLDRGPPVAPGFPREWCTGDGGLAGSRVAGLPADVVEAEALAQLEHLERLLGQAATHLDVHKHLHRHPQVLEGLSRVARRAGLPVRSIDAGMRAALKARGVATNDHFVGESGESAYWTPERFSEALAALPGEGVTEWMCHPGHLPEAVTTRYAAQREVERATFVDARSRESLEEAGVRPTDFRVLKLTRA
ncbi:carbohydrate deacetylase [Corallococcus aberystwythensis]|uniref:ChbG/HpnK family deacetylase n=1 Tax=Corallococcus aberystwythensis TaxID=2316722 RepID=A0A3A8QVG6_9BACT|nr:ChbG/HpnK family deacetylase [Corallococcus aberystwythensis]RKH71791.1 ChbG/HpnK family deacetylase [Corallococcus aberystwythensis]